MSESDRLQIAVVLPGSASLGAYQAGATASLIAGHNELRRRGLDIALPAWGGASAGASIALLAAHAMANGLDPVKVFSAAWVDGIGLDELTTGKSAPLGLDGLRRALERLMTEGVEDHQPDLPTPKMPVGVHVAMATLRGYRYQLDSLSNEPVDAVTYADWSRFTYEPDTNPRLMFQPKGSAPIDLVLASLANPVAFPPKLLDRRNAFDDYERRGLVDVTNDADSWWFTDGGLVQSWPIRRTLSMIPGNPRRYRCAVIDPRAEGPTIGTAWSDPDQPADWVASIVRALSIFPKQSLSDELRRLDRENQSLQAIDELSRLLSIEDDAAFGAWLSRRGLDRSAGIGEALVTAAGLEDARPVRADVIHPRLVVDGGYVPQLLAGEQLGDFAGFLSKELRSSDFSLGYESGRKWLESLLNEEQVDSADEVLAHVDTIAPPPWREVNRGKTQLGELGWRERGGLIKVALRALRALFNRG